MTISVLTLFPEMFEGPFSHSIIRNAILKKLINLNFVNIRDFGIGKHKVVDDRPYGGGRGMVLRVDVLVGAIESIRKKFKKGNSQKIILLDPSGKTFNQNTARRFSNLDHLVLICGHYEGFDARIKEFIDEEISIGDFVLTGGEIPAMAVIDSVARLKQGVLPQNATDIESFSQKEKEEVLLEFPQYTRPERFKNLKVPTILLSGDHEEIKKWRRTEALRITKKKRPDLLISKKAY